MKLPRDLSGSDVIKALKRLGFVVVHQVGSHVKLAKGNRSVTVPVHSSLSPKTLKSILNQAGITLEELMAVI